jgi:hypothetical protein
MNKLSNLKTNKILHNIKLQSLGKEAHLVKNKDNHLLQLVSNKEVWLKAEANITKTIKLVTMQCTQQVQISLIIIKLKKTLRQELQLKTQDKTLKLLLKVQNIIRKVIYWVEQPETICKLLKMPMEHIMLHPEESITKP